MAHNLCEEVLQRIYKGFEFLGAALAHLAEGLDASPQHREDPNRLEHYVEETIELVSIIPQTELLSHLRALSDCLVRGGLCERATL